MRLRGLLTLDPVRSRSVRPSGEFSSSPFHLRGMQPLLRRILPGRWQLIPSAGSGVSFLQLTHWVSLSSRCRCSGTPLVSPRASLPTSAMGTEPSTESPGDGANRWYRGPVRCSRWCSRGSCVPLYSFRGLTLLGIRALLHKGGGGGGVCCWVPCPLHRQ